MPNTTPFSIALLLAVSLCIGGACGDDGFGDIVHGDAVPPRDGTGFDAAPQPDAEDLGDRPIDLEGPTITIQQPTVLQVLDGAQTEVVALITDPDGVDSGSVTAIISGAEFSLNKSANEQDQYRGLIDLSNLPDGERIVRVQASDILGHTNSEEVTITRDTGPTVFFFDPAANQSYAGSVNLSFEVRDDDHGVNETSVVAQIGTVTLDIVKQDEDQSDPQKPRWIRFAGEIIFNDPIFVPPLVGPVQISVSAENIDNGVSATTSMVFVVDEQGPDIVVVNPVPGQLIGGIIDIEAQVTDDTGVLNTSVVAVLAHNAAQYEVPLTPFGNTFVGSFDTRVFPTTFVFPSISVRAADVLNNESSVGFLVSLDNVAPVLSLDPPETLFAAQENENNAIECSHSFDPVGDDNPDDLTRVPQVFYLRARIEDRGNEAVGLVYSPVSQIDNSTTFVYLWSDPIIPLVVDTDDDGLCDEINPDLTPSTNPQSSSEVLALSINPIPPSGAADFTPTAENLPAACTDVGDDADPPDTLCLGTSMTMAIFYTADPTVPAIYTLPPLDNQHPFLCTGQQFDSLANNIPEGWACAVVRAVDNVGNIGVSPPLRICVDYDFNPAAPDAPACDPAMAPDCTGTQDPITGLVTDTDCAFDTQKQLFRDREVRRIDLSSN